MKTTFLSPRTRNRSGADHHIWNNNGIWWCHFTVHHADHTKERVRVSLRTRDRGEARRQRDLLLQAVPLIAASIPRSVEPRLREEFRRDTIPAGSVDH